MTPQTAQSPEQLKEQGMAAFRKKDFAEAVSAFNAAAESYIAAGNPLDAAEMRNNASVASLKAGNAQTALDTALGTDLVFAQAGDTRRQALALGNLGAAYEALNRLEEAETTYTSCNTLLRQLNDNATRASVLASISRVQIRRGKQLQAMASMDAALENEPKLSLRQRLLKKLLDVPMKMLKRN